MYRFNQINYDENGNIINDSRRNLYNIFSRALLQSFSDFFEDEIRNISKQIIDQVNQYEIAQFPSFLYKNIPNKIDNVSCPICLEEYKDESMLSITDCIHFFHEKCLKKWIDTSHTTCPICRTDLK